MRAGERTDKSIHIWRNYVPKSLKSSINVYVIITAWESTAITCVLSEMSVNHHENTLI